MKYLFSTLLNVLLTLSVTAQQKPSPQPHGTGTPNGNYSPGRQANDKADLKIFADDLCTKLKRRTTKANIARLTRPELRTLAEQLYAGTYRTAYRVGEYECLLSYKTLSESWNAPGKFYDQLAGVTGISIPANSKNTVIVGTIPGHMTVELKVVAWWTGKVGQHFDGGNPHTMTFPLKKGLNEIDYAFGYDGLAYICYYADKMPEKYPDIKVHFVNGQVNGFLSPQKTNEEMSEICANAKNICMDVVGGKVHAIWTSEGLKRYCKSRDGKPGYRQYMNVLDSLIAWEHRQLGLEKYGRIPRNRTMAYVNYTYYMFQGGFGVSFHADQEPRVLDCHKLIDTDYDAIWGLSHEWGHQHQMHPYYCWAGMSEVSNNLQSYYNIMKMGYRTSDKIRQWEPARRHFLEDREFSSGTKTSSQRVKAYEHRGKFRFSPKMFAMCEAMRDSLISPADKNASRAVAYAEVGAGETLCPLIMLHNYFTRNGFPDFAPDWYESLRQNDNGNGSQVEKRGKADKYELIASAQNNNKNGKLAVLRKRFPNSCWVKDNYITETHCGRWENSVPYIMNYIRKSSRLVGYDLTPYFEKWGFLRQVALEMGDYGIKYYVMTPEMYNEFKADMDKLVKDGELKEMPAGMVKAISNAPDWFQPKPGIPN